MARISSVTREDVPDDQLEAFDQFVKQREVCPPPDLSPLC